MTGEKTHPTLPEGMGLRSPVMYPFRSFLMPMLTIVCLPVESVVCC
jgi:hypothetical protein